VNVWDQKVVALNGDVNVGDLNGEEVGGLDDMGWSG